MKLEVTSLVSDAKLCSIPSPLLVPEQFFQQRYSMSGISSFARMFVCIYQQEEMMKKVEYVERALTCMKYVGYVEYIEYFEHASTGMKFRFIEWSTLSTPQCV